MVTCCAVVVAAKCCGEIEEPDAEINLIRFYTSCASTKQQAAATEKPMDVLAAEPRLRVQSLLLTAARPEKPHRWPTARDLPTFEEESRAVDHSQQVWVLSTKYIEHILETYAAGEGARVWQEWSQREERQTTCYFEEVCCSSQTTNTRCCASTCAAVIRCMLLYTCSHDNAHEVCGGRGTRCSRYQVC